MGPIYKCFSMDVLQVIEVLSCGTLPQSHIFFDALIGGLWSSGKLMDGNFGNFWTRDNILVFGFLVLGWTFVL